MTDRIGIFGLGLIGIALARRLMRAGRQVIGHDPDPERGALLAGLGGVSAEPDAVWRQELVFSCVFDTDQLAGLIDAAPAGSGGRLVSLSTCDPARMPDLGRAAAARGWRLIEAPISGTSLQLADGEAVFLLGCERAEAEALAPLLQAITRGWHHVGPLGAGNRAKLAVNLVLGLNRAALAEGLVFAERLGLDPAAFLTLLQDTAAASAVMATKGPKMVARDFEPQGRIAQSAKDFGLILQAAAAVGQGLPLARTYAGLMRDCVEHGEIGLDNSAVIRAVLRAQAEG
ncbi:MAG: NAD(P)-dependent oxidoreductase [Alphaproteobacteria bacterium]|nr:MAG: NAD(P)-dependent oxidoreductase [Alphaproteobacteria bacterium]